MGVANAAALQILDIRNYKKSPDEHQNLLDMIIKGLKTPCPKSLPSLLLYDERGLILYDKVTTDAPEYYLFGAEDEILRIHACEIVQSMHCRSQADSKCTTSQVLLDLGSGSLRKTSHILRAFADLVPETSTTPSVTYFALDVEEKEIRRTLVQLLNSDLGSAMQGKIEPKGMLGTWDNGISFIRQGGLQNVLANSVCSNIDDTKRVADAGKPEHPQVHMLFLGSSIGNFARGEDAIFLYSLPLRAGYGDTLLLGLDHDNDREEIELAYNDPKGLVADFIMNGLRAAGSVLGDPEILDIGNWAYANSYDEDNRVHNALARCLHPHQITIPGTEEVISFAKDELVKLGNSLKYSERDAYLLFASAGLRPIQRWTDSTSRYSLWLLERPPFMFPMPLSPPIPFSKENLGTSIPSIRDWQDMWNAWDFITLRMIPSPMLREKSLDFRHVRLFYLGHMPTLLEVHPSQVQEPHTKPNQFKGCVRPDADDSTQYCLNSEFPSDNQDWPSLAAILSLRKRVRERLSDFYESISIGGVQPTRKIMQALSIMYEDEALYTETLLCMLLQRAGTGAIPPPDFAIPPWGSLLTLWNGAPRPSSATIVIEATTVVLGMDDAEADFTTKVPDVEGGVFASGQDAKSLSRRVSVDAFRMSWRPVTNGEFFQYYKSVGEDLVVFPASWVRLDDGEIRVRTLYGPVSMSVAWDWPILTSYDNLLLYASAKGGRLPTEAELRAFMDMFACGYEDGANIGFRNWHPVPATTGVQGRAGKGHNGGVWEWTSTVFDKFEDFVPSLSYPGYSADFVEGHYRVVLGGSFMTVPRIAEKRSTRNWYRRDYHYACVGGRVAYGS